MTFRIPPATRESQRRAADPDASVWVSANAGAGKTKVLTDRVIRLLLAGTPPARILCLTFTKAAAAEMTIRVFKQLGDWVTLDDLALRERLTELTGERPGRPLLATARRLFARAVETPGGLKIETIHAFCERVLHLVPFEANVPARFAVLDETQSADLVASARGEVLAEAAAGGELAECLETAAVAAGGLLTDMIDAAVGDERIPDRTDAQDEALARLARALGLGPTDTPAALRRAMVEDGIGQAEWPALAAAFRATGKAADRKRAETIDAALAAPDDEACLDAYLALVLKADGEPRSAKDLATATFDPAWRERLLDEQARLVALGDRLRAAEALARTRALYWLAGAIRRRAASLKTGIGALDFGDLIARTVDLLERDHAAWVLYKLDRGVDHVLVDEAQDTNPDQWRILRRLTEEFTAGAGRPTRRARTVFAVGDPKQSIYSFQGAEPREFEESRRHWLLRTRDAELRFEDVRLDLSFRSAPAILACVDATFALAAHFKGLSFADDVRTAHLSARPDAPGAVEIWPTAYPSEAADEPDAWTIPVDEPDRRAPALVAAERVAAAVRHWTTRGDETGRVWLPGEILVLARKRGPAFFAVINALKAAGIGVAGADRFDIGDHIAVADLVAAGGAALLPENDLVLAAALKSPLVGLDDDDLIRIAADRDADAPLAAALAAAAEAGDPAAERACAALVSWRDLAGRHGPFGFYAALLGPGGGRRRLVQRLGHEAADAIDSFLGHAKNAESGPEVATLTTFLARFGEAGHTIKRSQEAGADEVRVMTVHGAKGLEAPLVVMLDGCEVFGPEPRLIPVPTGFGEEAFPVWAPGARSDCATVGGARAALKARALEEHNRLLYVAMTRARDRLVVAPFATKAEPPEAWSAMIRRGLAEATHALVRSERELPHGPVELWSGDVTAEPERREGAAEAAPSSSSGPPDWLLAACPPEPEPLPPLRPSGALGAAERPDRARRVPSRAEARRRGTLIHGLIEALADVPDGERDALARAILGARAPGLGEAGRTALAGPALAVLRHPDLADLFGPEGRSEAPLAGTLAGRAVSGTIDRLLVRPDGILLADFKTGAHGPGDPVPASALAQIALYRALLAAIHPDRPIRALLVWTDGPTLVEPDEAALARALADALAAAGNDHALAGAG